VRNLSGIAALAVLGVAAPASANDPTSNLSSEITGDVVSARGRWTSDGLIVTDAIIRGDDGIERAVMQFGGRADGFGQRMIPGPEPLEAGTRVSVRVAPGQLVSDVALLTPSSFVRTGPTKAGRSLFWAGACVFMNPDPAGTTDLDGDTEFEVIDRVLDTWNDAVASCSYLQLQNGGNLAVTGTSGRRGR
jgi:hypothetical protein